MENISNKALLFTIDEANSDEEEVYIDLVGISSTVSVRMDEVDGKDCFVLTVMKPVFGEEDNPDEDVAFQWSFPVDDYESPNITCKVDGEYIYVKLYDGENDTHFQLKHEYGEGLVMDLVENGEVFDSLGYLTYDDMNREEPEEDMEAELGIEKLSGELNSELRKFDYKDKLETDDFATTINEIKAIYETFKSLVSEESQHKAMERKILNALATGGEFAKEAFLVFNNLFMEKTAPKKQGWEAGITPERAKEIREGLYLDRDVLLKRKDGLQEDILTLIKGRQENIGSVSITSHNTILALKDWNNEISFIVAQGAERGVINLFNVDAHLSVDRYEPITAKNWLEEPLVMNGGDDELSSKMSKVALSESDLRELVIKDKTRALAHTEDSISLEASLYAIMDSDGDIVRKTKEKNIEKRAKNGETQSTTQERKPS